MNIAIFGATGGIGGRVLSDALDAGHSVRVLVRDPAKLAESAGVTKIVGDIGEPGAVERAVAGSDAVIWAIGPSSNAADEVDVMEAGARNLVAAMEQHGVRRLVALSGAGITLDGERKPLRGRLMSQLVKLLARHVVEAKRREYRVFAAADLEWTLVRPPRVVEGPPSGRFVVGHELSGSRVTQGDLAAFMLREVVDGQYIKAAPFISSP